MLWPQIKFAYFIVGVSMCVIDIRILDSTKAGVECEREREREKKKRS